MSSVRAPWRRHAVAALLLLAGSKTAAAQRPAPGTGYVTLPGGRMFYEVSGTGPGTPLIVIHGGPGGTSCNFAPLKVLGDDRPVIRYDQLGTGLSDHPTDTTLWRLPRFVTEVSALRRALHLDKVIVLGHSWGGTVAAEYALTTRDSGLKATVLVSPLLSTPAWIADAQALERTMPEPLQAAIARHEADKTYDAPEYKAATDSFYARFLARRRPRVRAPECNGVKGNDTVYRYMWGPTEFTATGTLKSYDRSGEIGQLRGPVLFMTGEYDEARPVTLKTFADKVKGAQFVVVPNSGHAIWNDNPEFAIPSLRAFLREVDAAKK
ncbi:MAG: proline iminopeptidase-family hydrolase [Gemmatimonadetes bacterium]|nr:proline iminopeptidase-family hydrolase [Gemmatimonadota bacterium]